MKHVLLGFLFSGGLAWSQLADPPDCLFTATIASSGSSTVTAGGNGDNRSIGCALWVAVWEVTGGGSPVITIQQASTSGGLPVSWVTFNGSVVSGLNPTTGTVGTMVLSGFRPWMRFTLASGSGTLTGRLFGYRNPGAGASGGTVSISNFPATQTVAFATACPNKAIISTTAAGNTQIVAASGALAIKVCFIALGASGLSDIKLTQGTGANCGTGTADVTGVFFGAQTLALDRDVNTINGSASQALCLNSSAVVNIGGFVLYAQN